MAETKPDTLVAAALPFEFNLGGQVVAMKRPNNVEAMRWLGKQSPVEKGAASVQASMQRGEAGGLDMMIHHAAAIEQLAALMQQQGCTPADLDALYGATGEDALTAYNEVKTDLFFSTFPRMAALAGLAPSNADSEGPSEALLKDQATAS